MTRSRILVLLICLSLPLALSTQSTAQGGGNWHFPVPEPMARALDSITAQSLCGHVSFLSSDALGGRATPSVGQDVAAEYIAAQFRRSGLEPIGSDEYFQTSVMPESSPDCASFNCEIRVQGKSLKVPRDRFNLNAVATLDIRQVPVFKISTGTHFAKDLPSLSGKILLAGTPHLPRAETAEQEAAAEWREYISLARTLSPALIVRVDREVKDRFAYFETPRLQVVGGSHGSPLIAAISEPSIVEVLEGLPEGETGATLSLTVEEGQPEQRRLRNVAGLLRGSDPILRESYVLLTAHYDGTGQGIYGTRDWIWNAANDNASGVAALLDIALALGALKDRPRRSVVFLAFFGEEDGMLGSRYYAAHPLVPLRSTIAAINLEQLGRTDAGEGDQTGRASVTGYDYSEVGEVIKAAGDQSGIAISGSGPGSDMYFTASDNVALAEMGIPSHTLCVSFMYPDYHGAGDHWEKINFDNMFLVARMAARALLLLALSDHDPRWNMSNPRAARFGESRGRSGGAP